MKCGFRKDHGKVIEKTLSGEIRFLRSRAVLGIVPFGGPNETFAKPVETFFEVSIVSAPSSLKERGYELR